jgi:hypothetical protein
VLRLGRRVATLTGTEITVTALVTAMTSGRTAETEPNGRAEEAKP